VTFTVDAVDNCGSVSVVSVPPSGSTFPVGTTTVTNVVTDSAGNSNVCTFTVTVIDNEAPNIVNCPGNQILSADPGQCSRSNVTFTVNAVDNCGSVSVVSVPPSGSTDPAGTTTVTNIVTDSACNSNPCSFTVTVIDNEAPNIVNCPGNQILSADPGQCSRSNVTFTVNAVDNCGSVSVVSVPPSGSTFPVGTTNVTSWLTETECNSNVCTFKVTVIDNEAPNIVNCPGNQILSADPGQCSRSNVTFTVNAVANCGRVSVVSVPPSGSTFPVGTTTVTNIVTDSAGHS
jgi:rRNA maturation protein Nop10